MSKQMTKEKIDKLKELKTQKEVSNEIIKKDEYSGDSKE